MIENEALQDRWNRFRQEWGLKGLLWMAKFGISLTAVCPLSIISNVGCNTWQVRKCMELPEIREYGMCFDMEWFNWISGSINLV